MLQADGSITIKADVVITAASGGYVVTQPSEDLHTPNTLRVYYSASEVGKAVQRILEELDAAARDEE